MTKSNPLYQKTAWLYVSSPFIPLQTAELGWHQDLPYSHDYQDVYYSADDGIAQCLHVFINGNKLLERWNAAGEGLRHFTIAETGFGTGLNFLLTWKLWQEHAPANARLHFISCEKHPLSFNDLKKALANWPELKEFSNTLLQNYPVLTPGYHRLIFEQGRVSLTLMLGDVLEMYQELLISGDPLMEQQLRTAHVDAWFLDGFALPFNANMWNESLFVMMAMLSKQGTSAATHTAANQVKANFLAHGFSIEQKQGFVANQPMLSACFNGPASVRIKSRQTPWHHAPAALCNEKHALIIGAGLAGCFTAHSLAKRGWRVSLIDANQDVATQGSGNKQAVLFPKLSAYRSPLTQFMLTAFLYSSKIYSEMLDLHPELGELNGSLVLAYNEKEHQAQQTLQAWLQHYPELGELVNPSRASALAGIKVEQSGLFIPDSGWLNSPDLCRLLIDTPGIRFLKNDAVENLRYTQGRWQLNDLSAQVVVLATGYKINQFPQTNYLPIKAIRGQMTVVKSSPASRNLNIPLCAEGHVLPERNSAHYLGATYESNNSSNAIDLNDDVINLSKLNQIGSNGTWSDRPIDHWAGVRGSTPDYLPVVGPIIKSAEFIQSYHGLESNSKRWIATSPLCYPGLYACAGFGSRGLTSIPLCAEWLAGIINNELSCLPRSLVQAISPARFLRRDIIRGMHRIL